jgi:hypothetical protein
MAGWNEDGEIMRTYHMPSNHTHSPSPAFEDVIKKHFALGRTQLLAQCDAWLREVSDKSHLWLKRIEMTV